MVEKRAEKHLIVLVLEALNSVTNMYTLYYYVLLQVSYIHTHHHSSLHLCRSYRDVVIKEDTGTNADVVSGTAQFRQVIASSNAPYLRK